MKVTTLVFVLTWSSEMIQGEFLLTQNAEGKLLDELVTELWVSPPSKKISDRSQEKIVQQLYNPGDGKRAFQLDPAKTGIPRQLNNYLKNNLQRSVESLLDWDGIVHWMANGFGQRGHIQEMKIKKELIFFVLLVILKTLGVLVTKIKIAIGIMFLKLFIGKLVLLFMHLKEAKRPHGPLIKAYQTTTNEFHNHLGHKSDSFKDEEPFFPSPPDIHFHGSERRW